MQSDLVSIIVPCFNQGKYLSEALDSVLYQTHTNWECIIVNDGSTDDTEHIALNYLLKDDRFGYLFQQNAGPSSARNAAITLAKGKYILPLDADDYIGKTYLDLALNAFQANPNFKVVYCLANKFGHENGPWKLETYTFKNLLKVNCIFCSAVFKKIDWEICEGYDEELIHVWEDWDFWLKILDNDSEVYQIPEVLFFYRIKPGSRNSTITESLFENVRWKVLSKRIPDYQKHFQSPQAMIQTIYELKNLNKKIRNSISYKMGNALLKPLSYLKNWFQVVKKRVQ